MRSVRDRLLPAGSFRRQSATLLTGTALAQVVPLVTAPILTRLYSPSEYGAYAVFVAVALTISVIASGRYELAVVLPDSDDDARGLLLISLIVLVAGSILATVICVVVLTVPAVSAHVANATLFTFALPLALIPMGAFQSLSYWVTRKERFSALATSRITAAVVVAAVSVVLGVLGWGAGGLTLGFVAGQICAAGVLAYATFADLRQAIRTSDRARLRRLASSYREFPMVNAPHALVDGVRDSGITALIAALFGLTVNGLVSFATRMLRAPATLMAAAIGPAFFKRSSALVQEGSNLRTFLRKTTQSTAVVGAPFYIAIALFGPDIFALVFGEQWRLAGSYARILSPWLFVVFVLGPVTSMPTVAGRLRMAFRIALVDTLLKVATLLVGWKLGGALLGIGLLSAEGTCVGLGLLAWYHRIARSPRQLGIPDSTAGTPELSRAEL